MNTQEHEEWVRLEKEYRENPTEETRCKMNELVHGTRQLPDNIEDLARFVIIQRETLNAVRAQIRAIDKVGLAKEVHEQKLHEAQEIADAVLDAEVRIGELTARMEKASNQYSAKDTAVRSTKAQQLSEIGITEKQKQRYETLAKHPETVEKAKQEAREEGRIVTRADVLNRIAPPQTHKQTINQIKKQAREEIKEFEEAKGNGIVNIQDAQKDKLNKEIVALDILGQFTKANSAVHALGFLKEKEVEEAMTQMTTTGRMDLGSAFRESVRILNHLQRVLEESKGGRK